MKEKATTIKIRNWRNRPAHWNPSGIMDHLRGKTLKVMPTIMPDMSSAYTLHCSDPNYNGSPWLFLESDTSAGMRTLASRIPKPRKVPKPGMERRGKHGSIKNT